MYSWYSCTRGDCGTCGTCSTTSATSTWVQQVPQVQEYHEYPEYQVYQVFQLYQLYQVYQKDQDQISGATYISDIVFQYLQLPSTRKDFINSADMKLSKQQFEAIVDGLVDDLNMLGWIFDGAEGGCLNAG